MKTCELNSSLGKLRIKGYETGEFGEGVGGERGLFKPEACYYSFNLSSSTPLLIIVHIYYHVYAGGRRRRRRGRGIKRAE